MKVTQSYYLKIRQKLFLPKCHLTFRLFTTFFCARLGKMQSIFTGAKNCGGEKPHKGQSPTAVFRSPSRQRRRSVNSPVK
jgi:hypothetical protein